MAESLRNLSIILVDRGERTEAEAAARETLAMRRRLLANEHPLVAAALTDLTYVLGNASGETEALETETFLIQRNVLGDDHPDLARSLYLQGQQLRHRGELAESHAVLIAARSIKQKLLSEQICPEQLAAFRAMSGSRRLRLAERLHWSARIIKTAGVRSQQPDWSAERVRTEVRQIFSNVRT